VSSANVTIISNIENGAGPRDKNGKFSMGVVAKFEHEDGRVATVTKFNDKFHVNVLKNGQPNLPRRSSVASKRFSAER
jgi:hypothetical protein